MSTHGIAPKSKGKGLSAAFLFNNVNYAGEGCLTWPFSRHPTGYAGFGYMGKSHYAHRFMCELVNGPPPTPDHEAAHSCGRGKFGCVDPRHLSWKTISENALDCRGHGTQERNDRGNRGRLTSQDVAEIKSLQGYLTQAEIARMFSTSQPTVRDIFTGRSHAKRKLRKPLTDAEALMVRTSTMSVSEMARRLKCSRNTIHKIRRGVSYLDVQAPSGQSGGQK